MKENITQLTLKQIEYLIKNNSDLELLDIKDTIIFYIESTNIIELIKYELYQLTKNIIIQSNDIPNILNIILENKKLIYQYNNFNFFKIKINNNTLKYLLYCLIYYIIIENLLLLEPEKSIDFLQQEIENNFELCWKLIKFDLKENDKINKCLCYSGIFKILGINNI
jgi:hypothetical protein